MPGPNRGRVASTQPPRAAHASSACTVRKWSKTLSSPSGTKRMPMLQIDDDGSTSIDLWCTTVQAQATVGADGTITIVPGQAAPAQCTPERQTGDDSLLAALTQATNWRRNGDVIELTGATTLRFRLMSN